MAQTLDRSTATDGHFDGLTLGASRRDAGLLIALGIVTMCWGAGALYGALTTTLLTVLLVGVFLIVAAALQVSYAMNDQRLGGALNHILQGALYAICGTVFVARPYFTANTLTGFIVMLLFASGLIRLAMAVRNRDHRGWLILSGITTLVLGAYVIMFWPVASPVTLGLIVGADILFIGINMTASGLLLKTRPKAGQRTH